MLRRVDKATTDDVEIRRRRRVEMRYRKPETADSVG